MYLGLHTTDYVKRSKVKIMAGGHRISHTNEGNFTQFWPQMCLDL